MLCCYMFFFVFFAEVNEASLHALEVQQELVTELRVLREKNITLTAHKEALEKMCSEQIQQIQQLHQQRSHSPKERRHSKGGLHTHRHLVIGFLCCILYLLYQICSGSNVYMRLVSIYSSIRSLDFI